MQKTKIISLRLTQAEYNQIKQLANENEVTVSTFLKDRALSTDGLTLSAKQSIYKHLLIIKDVATNKISSDKIIKKCDTLWQSLK